ncbi:endospore germination permease [Paenibacillus qinlingensis]|uniref:Spore germination protein KB n=1 Tax=Paenibacillus qinlingensis TaxID=1837343 RepID=A0ABU1NY35_9BACL|nr:endospore germination permease [Paenibacillus qinlingensis]MDR6551737.1 spore germination protein KB [Paenibacillus qinlingensis]
MLEKGQISSFQLGIMMYPTVLATGFLALPTITSHYAHNDLWMTPLLASASGFIAIFVAIKLHELFPKQTISQYSTHIIGRIPGLILSFFYVLLNLHGAGQIARQYADFVKACFLFKTPLLMIIYAIILLAAFAVRGGVEMLARSAVIFTPVFILPLCIFVLLIPNMDIKNILPILEKGIVPVLKGTAAPQAWFSEFFLISYFLPYLSDLSKSRKWSVISLSIVVVTMIYVDLVSLFLFGPDTDNKIYPVLIAIRYISVANFFENLESLLLAMWVVGNFIKISIFYYVAVLSISQSLKLSDYRPYVFPLGLCILVFSFWDIESFSHLSVFLKIVNPFYVSFFFVLIPSLLLVVAVVRKRITTSKGT